MAEVAIAPRSSLAGKTVAEVDFFNRYGLRIFAINHRGTLKHYHLAEHRLGFGDALLVHGVPERIAALEKDEDFLVLEKTDTASSQPALTTRGLSHPNCDNFHIGGGGDAFAPVGRGVDGGRHVVADAGRPDDGRSLSCHLVESVDFHRRDAAVRGSHLHSGASETIKPHPRRLVGGAQRVLALSVDCRGGNGNRSFDLQRHSGGSNHSIGPANCCAFESRPSAGRLGGRHRGIQCVQFADLPGQRFSDGAWGVPSGRFRQTRLGLYTLDRRR